jgi:branched-chain amino acid transport system permease protein
VPGAALALVIWVAASVVLRAVLGESVGPRSTSIYGPLAAPIVVLIWLYFLAIAFLISAIGASFFLSTLASKMFNSQTTNQFPVFFNQNTVLFTVDGAEVKVLQVVIIGSAVVMMFALDRLVSSSKLGRGIRAVSEDAPTAALMGVDIDKTISRTFLIGGLLGGAAGFLFGLNFAFAYNMGFAPGVKAFAAAVLGGIGNIRGAMLGGLLIGVVENMVPVIGLDVKWTDVTAFVVLVLVLMFRPRGILGERVGRAA